MFAHRNGGDISFCVENKLRFIELLITSLTILSIDISYIPGIYKFSMCFSWFSWAINSLVKGEWAVMKITRNLVLKIEAFSITFTLLFAQICNITKILFLR